MVSSYLQRPIRTLEQALRDRIRARSRVQAVAFASTAERGSGPRSADTLAHVLPATPLRPSTSGRLTLKPPTDRRAA